MTSAMHAMLSWEPPRSAQFPSNTVSVMLTEHASEVLLPPRLMPPPNCRAVLPEKVHSDRCRCPPQSKYTPPPDGRSLDAMRLVFATLLVKVTLVRVAWIL